MIIARYAGKSQVLGKIEFDDQPIEMEDPNLRNLMAECSVNVNYQLLYKDLLFGCRNITQLDRYFAGFCYFLTEIFVVLFRIILFFLGLF